MRLNSITVINLRRRIDRLEEFWSRWVDAGLEDLSLAAFPAIDGAERPLPEAWANGAGAGAYGRHLSHMNVLRKTSGPALVLEDDAVFAEGFREALEGLEPLEGDWDLIYLGGQLRQYGGLVMPAAPRLVRMRFVQRTHAYIVRDPAKLAALLLRDVGVGAHLDRTFQDDSIVKHALLPFLVGQGASPSDVHSEQQRTRPYFWNTDERSA